MGAEIPGENQTGSGFPFFVGFLYNIWVLFVFFLFSPISPISQKSHGFCKIYREIVTLVDADRVLFPSHPGREAAWVGSVWVNLPLSEVLWVTLDDTVGVQFLVLFIAWPNFSPHRRHMTTGTPMHMCGEAERPECRRT